MPLRLKIPGKRPARGIRIARIFRIQAKAIDEGLPYKLNYIGIHKYINKIAGAARIMPFSFIDIQEKKTKQVAAFFFLSSCSTFFRVLIAAIVRYFLFTDQAGASMTSGVFFFLHRRYSVFLPLRSGGFAALALFGRGGAPAVAPAFAPQSLTPKTIIIKSLLISSMKYRLPAAAVNRADRAAYQRAQRIFMADINGRYIIGVTEGLLASR